MASYAVRQASLRRLPWCGKSGSSVLEGGVSLLATEQKGQATPPLPLPRPAAQLQLQMPFTFSPVRFSESESPRSLGE